MTIPITCDRRKLLLTSVLYHTDITSPVHQHGDDFIEIELELQVILPVFVLFVNARKPNALPLRINERLVR